MELLCWDDEKEKCSNEATAATQQQKGEKSVQQP